MKNRKKYQSRIARRILLQYALALMVFLVVYAGALWLAMSVYYSIPWQVSSPIYQLAQFVKRYLPIFIGAPILIAWALITFFFISRPLRYLDEAVYAAKRLTARSEEPVILPTELKEVQDELNQVREQSNENALIAREAEQRKNDLIVYLAHDLKTPLTSVIGYLTLLRDEPQISETLREKYLSISLEKAERLEELINEFFEITRFNLSNITLEYSRVDLTRFLQQLVFEFKPMLLEKNLDCVLESPPEVMIKCDANKMQRVFDNLLRNAVNYSFENTSIRIAVSQEGDQVCIRFTNRGNTIAKEKLDRIFEQFYRLDAARSSKSGGAGLGLAIAKQIVELHHGTIRAESRNETVEFSVRIPIA